MAINQLLPLVCIKLGLPLRYIVIAYSLSFVLIYYLCYVIAVYGFKSVAGGLSIAFVPIVIRLAFGHSISEAWLGVVYSGVFYALLSNYQRWNKKGKVIIFVYYFLMVLLILINYFIHPLSFFTVGFAIGFNFLHQRNFKSPHLYIAGMIVIMLYTYQFLFPGDDHNQGFFEGIKNADQYFPRLFQLPLINYFRHAFWTTYFYAICLLVITIILYIKEKKFSILFFVVGFILLYIIIACLAFYAPDSHTSMESRFIPILFFIMIPLVERIRNGRRKGSMVYLLAIALICSYVSLVKMVTKFHTPRIALYEYVLKETKKYPTRKFCIRLPTNRYHVVNSWGSAAETLLLSSMNGREHSTTILFYDDNFGAHAAPEGIKCLFLWVPWYPYTMENNILNKKYFDLQCSKYQELPYPAQFTGELLPGDQ
jgi:hypothetical protein